MKDLFRARVFEFRHRFWFVAAFYSLAFFCYRYDHENFTMALTKWIMGRGTRLDPPPGSLVLRLRLPLRRSWWELPRWGKAFQSEFTC
ncbi:MAG: hypothetical protein ACRD4K_08515 [Candidatus Acidiferrales bacterium]